MNEQARRIAELLVDLVLQYQDEPDPQRYRSIEQQMQGAILAADTLGLTPELLPIYRTNTVLEDAARAIATIEL